jgi:PAS domain S-box-containing protein
LKTLFSSLRSAQAFGPMAEALRQRTVGRRPVGRELRRLNQTLMAISQCHHAVVRATEESGLLREICRIIVEAGNYRLAWVGFAEQDETKIVARAAAQAGLEEGHLEPAAITLADTERKDGPAGTAIRTGKPVVVSDCLTDPTYAPWRDQATRQGYASSIALPLVAGSRPFGALSIYSQETNAFGVEIGNLLVELASDLAYEIVVLRTHAERKQAKEALRRRNRELELLNRASRVFISSFDLDQVLAAVLEDVRDLLGATACSAWLIDTETGELVCRQATGPRSEVVRGWRLAPDQGIVGWVAHSGEASIVADTQTEARHFNGIARQIELEIRSLLSVPLKARADVIGVLQVVHTKADRFSSADQRLLESLAGSAAIAIENARLYELAQQEISERVRAEKEVSLRNRELELLNQVIAVSASEWEPNSILETACRELARAFDLPQAVAALLNTEKTAAEIVAEYRTPGRPPALNETIHVNGNPSFQYLLTHRAPLAAADAQHDPRLAPVHDLLRQRGIVSLLILPLVIRDEVIGSLNLDVGELRNFSAEEVSLAWSVAEQVAGALAHARLARGHRRLITAVEQIAEGVLITDTQGTILYTNPAFGQITGYSQAEVAGQDSRILANSMLGTLYEEAWATISAGKAWHRRLGSRRRDGSLYTADVTVSPVRDEGGEIVNYVVLQRDVTRELELEEQYQRAQKMELVGRLTAGIAHDFNNLLTAINGFAELARTQPGADDEVRELLDKVLDAGRRAAGLVRQLLAFSRKQIIEPQTMDLNDVVGDMSKMLRHIIGEDIRLRTRLASDLWPVVADPAQIEQVIVNLAVNARDAMPHGGELTIETASVTLDDGYVASHLGVKPGEYVLVAVSDTGVGMSREVQAHIFEPFFTTKENGKGTGLGLTTACGIIKQGGGDIQVYSEEGVGTTFKIYLPRSRKAIRPSVDSRTEMVEEPPSGSETILVIEDNARVRELARLALQQRGYAVLEAENGTQALQVAAHHSGSIHMLLTDVVLPGLSGMALAKQLVQVQPGLKTLFMSGYADETIVYHGLLEPGVILLQKPFSPITLARKVRAVLDAPASCPSAQAGADGAEQLHPRGAQSRRRRLASPLHQPEAQRATDCHQGP